MKYAFAIPYEVPSQNVTARRHWRHNYQDVDRTNRLARIMGNEACHAKKRRSVTITSYRTRRITDHANLVGGCKSLVDGLVRAGVLVDDSDRLASITYAQAVLSQMPVDLQLKFAGRPCTLIEVEDMPNEPTKESPCAK